MHSARGFVGLGLGLGRKNGREKSATTRVNAIYILEFSREAARADVAAGQSLVCAPLRASIR